MIPALDMAFGAFQFPAKYVSHCISSVLYFSTICLRACSCKVKVCASCAWVNCDLQVDT